MKKLIIIFLFFLITFKAFAFIPSTVYDYKIGRLDQIEKTQNSLKISFDNFVYYKIWDYFDIFDIYKNRNAFVNEMINIEYFPDDIDLKSGDIVAIDSYWGVGSSGILKLWCENYEMKIYGTKSKYFGTSPLRDDYIKQENNKYADDYLLEKFSEKVGCENLDNYFNKDRRFEDLFGRNFKLFFEILILVLFFGLIIFSKNLFI